MVIGGGFAGVAVAAGLERRLRAGQADIVLLSRENFTLFTPMLPEVVSGELEVRHVVTPIRSELKRTRFVLADVLDVDVAAKTVTYQHVLTGMRATIGYDHVVFALGSSTSTFGLPGIAENSWPLKSLDDADALRNHLIWLLELADAIDDEDERRRLLTLAIVGGGFTGVETAGEMIELFHSVFHFYPRLRRGDLKIVLVEAGKGLLAGLPAQMGVYARRVLERRGVEVLLGDGVTGADARALSLQSGRRIETATIVWSAGVAPSPTVAKLPLEKTKRGAIVTGRDMRVPGVDGAWALGDCAAIPDGEGGTYPMTAQHAIREGPHLAANIAAVLHGRATTPFTFKSLGMMAALGARKAVAELPGHRVLTGFVAWFLWRSYYLLRLPGLDRKFRVAFDWTLDLLFPRDIAELRVDPTRAERSAGEP